MTNPLNFEIPVEHWEYVWSKELKGGILIRFAELTRKMLNKRLVKFFLRFRPKGNILEAGSGSGMGLVIFGKKGFEIVGIDYSNNSIELAKKNFKKNNIKGILVKANIKKIPFLDNTFSLVFNQGVIEHFSISEATNILREMKRVSNNLIAISVPGNTRFYKIWVYFAGIFWKFPQEKLYTPQELISLFKKASLLILEIKKIFGHYACIGKKY
ncbi:class I SAM-dependent methyltransferase [Candidatus Aminicenantes bacterium AH-873-B07]|jgi:2-polyprenyl-3-methyl-5-hydroxy-6-metoxy-1,4-benzoquinol methylase|nr:class I SAM-dependent methyltransferase [Candidatus Aminicenantes bacterium AH-873-B07]